MIVFNSVADTLNSAGGIVRSLRVWAGTLESTLTPFFLLVRKYRVSVKCPD
jgi:hypothetical protein